MTDDGLSMDLDSMHPAPEVMAEVRLPPDPCVSHTVGCGELAPLMIAALAWRPDIAPNLRVFGGAMVEWLETAAQRAEFEHQGKGPRGFPAVWAATSAKRVPVPTSSKHLPACVAEKAGLRVRPKQDRVKADGVRLEAALWRRFAAMHEELGLDPTTLRYALDGVPAAWLEADPQTGREKFSACRVSILGHALSTKPDGWGVTLEGESLVVNCKATMMYKPHPDPPAWLQMQGELAVCGMTLGMLPHGQCWLQDDPTLPPSEERRVDVFPVRYVPRVGEELVAFADRALAWIRAEADLRP